MRSAELVGVAQTIACCGEIGGVGRRREIAQSRMRPALVVVVDPVRDLGPGMIEAEEQALVEKLVAHAPVETLAEAVLHRPWLAAPFDQRRQLARHAPAGD